MTREEQVKYLKYALNLQEIVASERVIDTVIETYERLMKLGGDMSLKDVAEIEKDMKLKYGKGEKSGE